MIGSEDGRHAVMDRSKHLVRSGDGDRATLDPFAIGTVPVFPETREGKWLIACDADEIRLLPTGWHLSPFVEAVGDDEAAALPEGVRNAGFSAIVSARALIVL
jgi:hypothetical protein